jgi:DNA adenine methylase
MQYFGGKAKIAKKLVSCMKGFVPTDFRGWYVEPFVGGGWMLNEWDGPCGGKTASDLNKHLIDMYIALQCGWVPPDNITENDYSYYKSLSKTSVIDPMIAFVGFGCSFAGKWFGGFARGSESRNYCLNAKNSILKKKDNICSSVFYCGDYQGYLRWSDCVFYCDPPYCGTTQYGAVGDFDSESFWSWCFNLGKNNLVFISEYACPSNFTSILDLDVKTDIRDGGGNRSKRQESLFVPNSCLDRLKLQTL